MAQEWKVKGPLATALGCKEGAKHTWKYVLKKMWAHIKAKGLMKDGKVHPDAKWSPVLGKHPLKVTQLPSQLRRHMAAVCP